MKPTLKLIIILSLCVQFCNAQTVRPVRTSHTAQATETVKAVRTLEEHKVVFDDAVSSLKRAKIDTSRFTGKPVSELVKYLNQRDIKITQTVIYNDNKVYNEHTIGIYLTFIIYENNDFVLSPDLTQPYISIYFKDGKPYEKAISLFRENKGKFTKEVEEFYSDAIIKWISVFIPDDMYMPHVRKQMKR